MNFKISPAAYPDKTFSINQAFTASQLALSDHTYPVLSLQKRHKHLQGIPLPPINKASPQLLIGSDHIYLITPIAPVRLGPSGSPAAVKARLGWTLQSPIRDFQFQNSMVPVQCLFTSFNSPADDLRYDVEKLWKLDSLPISSEKAVMQSRQDQQAIELLEQATQRVQVSGVSRYATPLLRSASFPLLNVPQCAVMSQLRNTEARLSKDPARAMSFKDQIAKLEQAGYVAKLSPGEVHNTKESWYINSANNPADDVTRG